jgi:hypothetical protein
MDPRTAGIFQGLGGCIYVLYHGPAQGTDLGIFDHPGNLGHGLKITGTGDGKSGFYDIYSQAFQLQGQLNFFSRIEFATGHLLAIAQCGIKDVYFIVRHKKE